MIVTPHGKIYNLLSQTDRHPKIVKNLGIGVLSKILHLAPGDMSGYEVCPMRSEGCTKACLHHSGFKYARKEACRIRKTKFFFEQRDRFMDLLASEIASLERSAKRQGLIAGVRLNGTSDIPWERIPVSRYDNIMALFPNVCFMDYTKRSNRRNLPVNYRLTFSRSEDNDNCCVEALKNGLNVAVVFRSDLPEYYRIGGHPYRVIDGDETDWRYGDYDVYKKRVIVGLTAKGKMGRNDKTGFVVKT